MSLQKSEKCTFSSKHTSQAAASMMSGYGQYQWGAQAQAQAQAYAMMGYGYSASAYGHGGGYFPGLTSMSSSVAQASSPKQDENAGKKGDYKNLLKEMKAKQAARTAKREELSA